MQRTPAGRRDDGNTHHADEIHIPRRCKIPARFTAEQPLMELSVSYHGTVVFLLALQAECTQIFASKNRRGDNKELSGFCLYAACTTISGCGEYQSECAGLRQYRGACCCPISGREAAENSGRGKPRADRAGPGDSGARHARFQTPRTEDLRRALMEIHNLYTLDARVIAISSQMC